MGAQIEGPAAEELAGSSEIVLAGRRDGSENILPLIDGQDDWQHVGVATLHAPEEIGGEITHHIPVLRQIWWQHHALGFRYPPELGIILIEGGRP